MDAFQGRRTFVSSIGAMVAGLFGAQGRLAAQNGSPASAPPARATAEFDLGWFDRFSGTHKQLYDLGGHDLSVDPNPLRFPRNYLDKIGRAHV